MKIFILLLALGLCLADAVPGGYQQIDTTEAQADTTIQSYIQTGLDAVVQNAINKGFFSNSDFTLASVNSVSEQVVNGANYKFDCNFTDSQGVVIQANFIIHQSATTNATTLSSFAYKVYYPATTTSTTTTTTTTNVPTTSVETEEDSAVEEESGESGETGEAETTESVETVEAETTESGETVEANATESGEAETTESGETTESSESVEAGTTESGEADTTSTTIIVTGQADNNSTTETATTSTTDAATNTTETSTEASVNTTTPATNETAVVSADGFTAISAEEFSQSDDLNKYFTFGFETVVQNGINSGKIPNTTFTSAKVLGASHKAVKNGDLYKFTAQATNGDNVDLELGFEVVFKVPAYSYKVRITTTIPADNGSGSDDNSTTPVDTGAGSDNNTTTPVDNGSGSDNTTTPVDTGAGSDNNTTTPIDTGAGSDNNTTTPVDTGAGSDNNTTTPVDTGAGSDNNTTTPVDTGAGSDNNTTTPVDTNTTTPTNSTSADEWVVIDLAQAQQSAEIQSNLANGFNQVIQTVVQKKLLAADNYTITQVVAVSRHNLTNGVNYKFTVKANNDDQTFFLNMNFTTYYRFSNQSVKTVAYHYTYYTKAAPVQNNTNNNTTPAQNNTTPAQNTTTPAQNNTTPAQNTTTPAQNTTSPAQNTTTPAQNNTSGYVTLSATEIQAQDVQNAINYGSNQVVQLGIQKGKIPTDTYNITQVASVLKKIQPSGANYNATVTLKSAANVTVNTNFNVYYNSTSNAMILKAYSYGVNGLKKNNTAAAN